MSPPRAVVLATGGIGGLFAHTTNPLGAIGSGLAMAARAGAVLRDLEFVQFHPTAVDLGRDPMPLATEALRGEGAVLVNGTGERFMADVPGAELAPRDVVARAIWRELQAGERVYLDGRAHPELRGALSFRHRACAAISASIRRRRRSRCGRQRIIIWAASRSTGAAAAIIAGLWACGEVAATGLHGANRLASNSLLEAMVFAAWIAADIAAQEARGNARPAMLAERRRAPARAAPSARAWSRASASSATRPACPTRSPPSLPPTTMPRIVGLLIAAVGVAAARKPRRPFPQRLSRRRARIGALERNHAGPGAGARRRKLARPPVARRR